MVCLNRNAITVNKITERENSERKSRDNDRILENICIGGQGEAEKKYSGE